MLAPSFIPRRRPRHRDSHHRRGQCHSPQSTRLHPLHPLLLVPVKHTDHRRPAKSSARLRAAPAQLDRQSRDATGRPGLSSGRARSRKSSTTRPQVVQTTKTPCPRSTGSSDPRGRTNKKRLRQLRCRGKRLRPPSRHSRCRRRSPHSCPIPNHRHKLGHRSRLRHSRHHSNNSRRKELLNMSGVSSRSHGLQAVVMQARRVPGCARLPSGSNRAT